MNHLRDLNRCLDQAVNMSMKIPVLGFTLGILIAALIGGVEARDDGRALGRVRQSVDLNQN